MLRLAAEPLVPRKRDDDDESVWDFARRRIGAEAADRLIAPMTLGVFAGDARNLSLPAAFPRMAALEKEYGSLVRAMIMLRRKRKRDRRRGGPAGPGGGLFSFRMPELSNAMVSQKLASGSESGSEVLISADPGCLMHMRSHPDSHKQGAIRLEHVAELLEKLTA